MYEDIAIPFKQVGNRRCLTELQRTELPFAAEFIAAFPHCFEFDPLRQIHIFIESD